MEYILRIISQLTFSFVEIVKYANVSLFTQFTETRMLPRIGL